MRRDLAQHQGRHNRTVNAHYRRNSCLEKQRQGPGGLA